MNILLGLFVLVIGGGLGAAFAGMALDRDGLAMGGIGVCIGALVVAVVGFGIALILGIPTGSPIVEGACYRGVRHTTTVIIPVGKVLVPSTTSGIDLEEIRCPA